MLLFNLGNRSVRAPRKRYDLVLGFALALSLFVSACSGNSVNTWDEVTQKCVTNLSNSQRGMNPSVVSQFCGCMTYEVSAYYWSTPQSFVDNAVQLTEELQQYGAGFTYCTQGIPLQPVQYAQSVQ